MDNSRKASVQHFGEQKVIGELAQESIQASGIEELRTKILILVDKFHPTPIIVKTGAFPDSYVVGRQYYHADPKGIFEIVGYNLRPDSSRAIAIRKAIEERKMQVTGRIAIQPDQQQSEKNQSQALDTKSTEREDELIERSHANIAKSFGMEKYDDFIRFMKESLQQGLASSSSNMEEAISKARQSLMQRYYEHGGIGAYAQLNYPKQELADSIILFRVIAKGNMQNANHMRYYLRLHNIRANVTNNSIYDG